MRSADGRIEEILRYWFGDLPDALAFPDKGKIWFRGGEAVDQEIRKRFGQNVKRASRGGLDHWTDSPRGRLALIILLDQFSRNVYRDTPQAFAQDQKALQLALSGIEKGEDKELKPVEQSFFYMPLQHSEDLAIQKQSVKTYTELAECVPPAIEFPMRNVLDYAVRHLKIIERFGRFPHRNKILGRESTPEETEFLKTPGSSF